MDTNWPWALDAGCLSVDLACCSSPFSRVRWLQLSCSSLVSHGWLGRPPFLTLGLFGCCFALHEYLELGHFRKTFASGNFGNCQNEVYQLDHGPPYLTTRTPDPQTCFVLFEALVSKFQGAHVERSRSQRNPRCGRVSWRVGVGPEFKVIKNMSCLVNIKKNKDWKHHFFLVFHCFVHQCSCILCIEWFACEEEFYFGVCNIYIYVYIYRERDNQ